MTTQAANPIGYRAAHAAIADTKGLPVWLMPCVDCKGDATEWSYDHLDPDELIATDRQNLGAPYSLKADHYHPRCKRDHLAFDRAHRQRERERGIRPAGAGSYVPAMAWAIRRFARNWQGLDDDPISDVRELLGSYITAQEDHYLDTATLWIAGTHLASHDVGYAFPRLAITAPDKGSGKSNLLELVARLSHNGGDQVLTGAISEALIPRMIAEGFQTICLDEVDKTLKADHPVTGVINSGWQRGATVPKLLPDGDGGWKLGKLPTFSPIAFGGIGVNLADDTRQRTLYVRLIRNEDAPDMHRDQEELIAICQGLRDRLAAWAEDAADFPRVKRPPVPEALKGRDRDRWSVLLGVAHGVGGGWIQTAEELAVTDADERRAGDDQMGPNQQLAWDLFAVWDQGADHMASTRLVDALAVLRPDTWGVPSGKVLTVNSLGYRLREHYNVRTSRGSRDSQGKRERGFTRADMIRVWRAARLPISDDGTELVVDAANG